MAREYKHLTLEQRIKIKNMLDEKKTVSEICKIFGVHSSTIYREVKKGMKNGQYDPYYSQELYNEHLKKCGPENKLLDKKLANCISDMILKEHLSPEKIVNILKTDKINFPDVPTKNTIYNAIDKGLIPNVTRESLLNTRTSIFGGGQICIPKWVLEKLTLKDGDILEFEVTEDEKIIYKKLN